MICCYAVKHEERCATFRSDYLRFGATINFNLQLGFVTIVGSAHVALDNQGNFGITLAPAGGVGVGVNSRVNLSIQVSNAKTICDLGGPFTNLSAGAGAGVDASVDRFFGTSDHGPVAGVGVGLGSVEGVGASTTVTTTGRWRSLPQPW
jgi:hypothetical protein